MSDFQNDDAELPASLRGLEGLPQSALDEIMAASRLTLWRWLGNWLFMIIMISGFGIGIILWNWLENITNQNALDFARNIGGFSFSTNFGIGLLIGLFVWIIASALIVSIIIRLVPMPVKAAFYFAGRKEIEITSPKFVRRWANQPDITRVRSASDLINQRSGPVIKGLFFSLLPFIILTAIMCAREVNTFRIFSYDGVYSARLFSMGAELKRWEDASHVKLGCNQTDDGGHLIYEVGFPDGSDFRLPDDNSINGESWLTNIERVDAALAQNGARFERWVWMDRDALHPRCLRGFYADMGEGGKARLDRLLRIGVLPN